MLLSGLCLVACSACFLIAPRTTSCRGGVPHNVLALLHQLLIKTIQTCLNNPMEAFLKCLNNPMEASSQITLVCVVDLNLASTYPLYFPTCASATNIYDLGDIILGYKNRALS